MTDFEIQYPEKDKNSLFLYHLRKILKNIMILGFFSCPIVNYFVKGKAWCFVALWGIFIVWRLFLEPDVLEYISIGQIFRTSAYAIIEVALVGIFLSPGWLLFVLPLVGLGCLVLSITAFFIRLDLHKNETSSLLLEDVVALAATGVVYLATGTLQWPMIALAGLALTCLVMGTIVFHKEIWRDVRKRLHTR